MGLGALKLFLRTIAVIVVVLALHLLGGCKVSEPVPAPSFAAVHGNISQAQTHAAAASTAAAEAKVAIARAQSLAPAAIPDLREALNIAQGKIDVLTTELVEVQEALTNANTHISALETQVIALADQLNTALAHDAASTAKYHRLKFYCCLIAAAAAFLLVFQFRNVLVLLGPYGFIAYGAAPAAVFGLCWWLF